MPVEIDILVYIDDGSHTKFHGCMSHKVEPTSPTSAIIDTVQTMSKALKRSGDWELYTPIDPTSKLSLAGIKKLRATEEPRPSMYFSESNAFFPVNISDEPMNRIFELSVCPRAIAVFVPAKEKYTVYIYTDDGAETKLQNKARCTTSMDSPISAFIEAAAISPGIPQCAGHWNLFFPSKPTVKMPSGSCPSMHFLNPTLDFQSVSDTKCPILTSTAFPGCLEVAAVFVIDERKYDITVYEDDGVHTIFKGHTRRVFNLSNPISVFIDAATKVVSGGADFWLLFVPLDPTGNLSTQEYKALVTDKTRHPLPSMHFFQSGDLLSIDTTGGLTIQRVGLSNRLQITAVYKLQRKSAPVVEQSNLDVIAEDLNFRADAIATATKKRGPPSTCAQVSNLRMIQNPTRGDAMYNGRPIDLLATALVIYNPVFAKFLREYAAAPDPSKFTRAELNAARDFFLVSCSYYENEKKRHEAIENYLGILLGEGLMLSESTLSGTDAKPDGHGKVLCLNLGGIPAIYVIVEEKNEPGTGKCDPLAQGECVYITTYSAPTFEAVRNACCCPAFIITMTGPQIMVAGAVFPDKFMSQVLTDGIYIAPSGGKSDVADRILRIAHLCRVLRGCLAELKAYYADLQPPHPPTNASEPSVPMRRPDFAAKTRGKGANRSGTPSGSKPIGGTPGSSSKVASGALTRPVVSPFFGPHFVEFTDPSGKVFTLTYERRMMPSYIHKAVFKARMSPKNEPAAPATDVVVKFALTYCKEAHALLAKKKYAPALFYCKQEASVDDMWVVVMEYIKEREPDANAQQQVEEDVKKAVKSLHDAGYVFGDLRDVNILYVSRGEAKVGAMLVDFDWAGKENEVYYPADLNKDISWPRGVGPCAPIRKEHDDVMFKQLTI